MANTDFVDDDLWRRDSGREGHASNPADPNAAPNSGGGGQDTTSASMARRKEEINSQVAHKMDELERLRSKQEALDREKRALEELRKNQEDYEAGRREMIDRFEQSLLSLDREETSLTQRLELLVNTEKRFKEMLTELRSFNTDEWPTDSAGFRETLGKALVIIEESRKEFNKTLARIEASREAASPAPVSPTSVLLSETLEGASGHRSFSDWLTMGFALTLPVLLLLAILIGVLVVKLRPY